jgi:AmiR/NasT family two-component response regulator
MLMERFEIGAAQAFELLKRVSQESNTPIAQIAQRVITGDHSLPVQYPC